MQLQSVYCQNNALISLTPPDNLQVLECGNNKFATLTLIGLARLTSLNVSDNALLTTLMCTENALTSLNFTGCTMLQKLYCYSNHLTSLDISSCTQLQQLYCYRNYFTQEGMTALVNNLPDRSTTTTGNLRVLYDSGEQNVFNASHVAVANDKNWKPYKYSNSSWVEITATLVGDVNGDGSVNISDVTYLIDLLLSNDAAPAAADVNGDSSVNISDVTYLIDLLLSGH